MHLVSIHSHKGGSGKTTFGLALAQYLTSLGKKVCLIDLDLVAPGVEYLAPCEAPLQYLNDFIRDDDVALDRLTAKGCVCDVGEGKDVDSRKDRSHGFTFDVVLASSLFRDFDDIYGDVLFEHTDDSITGKVRLLLEKLTGLVDTTIVDNSPGVAYISAKVMQGLNGRDGRSTSVFVTSPERADLLGVLGRLAGVSENRDGSAWMLLVNKVALAEHRQLVQVLAQGGFSAFAAEDEGLADLMDRPALRDALGWADRAASDRISVRWLPFSQRIQEMSQMARPRFSVLRLDEGDEFVAELRLTAEEIFRTE